MTDKAVPSDTNADPDATVTVERLGAQGDGVARTETGPVFLPFTAPGDRVRVTWAPDRKGRQTASTAHIETAGDGRADPVCDHYGRCGGCRLQHVTDAVYADFVRDKIHAALSQHGLGDTPLAPPRISPPGSRRRLVLAARVRNRAVQLGFHEARSHRIVAVAACPVARPALVALLPTIRAFLADALDDGRDQQATLTLTETDNGVDLTVTAAVAPGLAAREAAAALAEDLDLAAINWTTDAAPETLVRRRAPTMDFGTGAAEIPLPPAAFIQATAEGEAALRAVIADACAGAHRVADLFCGLGTFAVPLARSAGVRAVEGSRALLDALDTGARRSRLRHPIQTEHRDLFRRPLLAAELAPMDAVVIDPPRAGAKAQAEALAASTVPVIAAVSCNPATFARDARVLVDGGYRLERLQPVGQFLWSAHVELAAVFRR
ncbi:hypothetical protein CCR85_05010 [Rhodothalassium salexigens]|uniref:class I SAM-dependent RNA methyltransferase n=1 Tax=Rhodothalassium salexigens TaxID=1086 RepID=UPI0019145F84|nr:class I SAM-dependent RNA methyltransferase [Rhodothalassium salexigens]MBK5910852.1 hypothetical protein [Rhodothalassium salexigens]